MVLTTRLIKIEDDVMVEIPSKVLKRENLQPGDMVKLKINKIKIE